MSRQAAGVKNLHGVEGVVLSTGSCYTGIREDGTRGTYAPVFVPLCCTECVWFDAGEFGDYGTPLSPPYCEKNVWFPTRTGTCKKQQTGYDHE